MTDLFRHSALHEAHETLDAQFTSEAGWSVPSVYHDAGREAAHARERVGIIDLSATGKIEITGRGLAEWLRQRFPVADTPPQCAVHLADAGGVTGLWLRLRPDRGLLITLPEEAAATRNALTQAKETHITDVTSVYTALRLVGPQSVALLRKFTSLDLRSSRFPQFSCAQASFAKTRGLIVRDDIGELPSFWILITRDYGEFVWEALTHGGHSAGLEPFGYEAHALLSIPSNAP